MGFYLKLVVFIFVFFWHILQILYKIMKRNWKELFIYKSTFDI